MAGKTFPAFPAHAQPTILRIWKEANVIGCISHVYWLISNNNQEFIKVKGVISCRCTDQFKQPRHWESQISAESKGCLLVWVRPCTCQILYILSGKTGHCKPSRLHPCLNISLFQLLLISQIGPVKLQVSRVCRVPIYSHMWTLSICCWCPDRSNCIHWSFGVAVLPINHDIYTEQGESIIIYYSVSVLVAIQLWHPIGH